ncbi:uncharacterized protein LOC113769493 [Coffea eugenioides]|uniref:uncharacterized protein LOC113769493 n=1 Tax=Coffea eugenioides TaxID=49369 RepID=UPI000F60DB9F|nr:uncharacterized protein LOC113769493 [Coffea eugenioides]
MGSRFPPTSLHLHHNHRLLVWPNSTTFSPTFFNCLASFCSRTQFTTTYIPHLHRSCLLSSSHPRKWSTHCRATSPGPPSPPQLDPPPGDNPPPSSGLISSFSRIKDTVRIFFAVLFWMSLFFWSCVWDGRNIGRPKNGSRFRR